LLVYFSNLAGQKASPQPAMPTFFPTILKKYPAQSERLFSYNSLNFPRNLTT